MKMTIRPTDREYKAAVRWWKNRKKKTVMKPKLTKGQYVWTVKLNFGPSIDLERRKIRAIYDNGNEYEVVFNGSRGLHAEVLERKDFELTYDDAVARANREIDKAVKALEKIRPKPSSQDRFMQWQKERK